MNMRLLCLPVKYGIKNLERRDEVPEEVYSSKVMMEHPAIPGLMLSLEERIYGGYLEIWEADTEEVRDETLGEVRDETPKEKSWRVQWKKPIARSESRTGKDHVPMNMGLFKKTEKEKPKNFFTFYKVQALKTEAAKAKAYRELEEAQRVAAIMVVEETPAQSQCAVAVAEEIQEMPAKVQSAADVQEVPNKYLLIISKYLDPELELIKQAKRVCKNDEKKSNPRLEWLERQLANVVAELQAIFSDIESGSSISDLGFSGDEDFQEMIDDLGNEIAKLKSMIQTLKKVEVGVER